MSKESNGQETPLGDLDPNTSKRMVDGRAPSMEVLATFPQGKTLSQKRGWFYRFLRWLNGYTGTDMDRLKEGAVQQVEGKGRTAIAEAEAKEAEAAELFAKAAHEYAEANKANAEAYSIRKKAEGDYIKTTSEAFLRISEALESARREQSCGTFNEKDILLILIQGQKGDPADTEDPHPEK